jgi:hypothetical protein
MKIIKFILTFLMVKNTSSNNRLLIDKYDRKWFKCICEIVV